MNIVTKWTSSGKTFKIGDVVVNDIPFEVMQCKCAGVITSIEVCAAGDGHVILDGDPNTLTDFYYIEFDKAHYRNIKLEELGI